MIHNRGLALYRPHLKERAEGAHHRRQTKSTFRFASTGANGKGNEDEMSWRRPGKGNKRAGVDAHQMRLRQWNKKNK